MKFFNREEFACKCGCGKNEIDDKFLAQLDIARAYAGVPFIINSGYRCPIHNKEVGSSSQNHIAGKAADIQAADGQIRGKILRGLYLAGFRRIGISKTFIHVDSMESVENAWLY
jgi:zinc D-Ala-D-Ala carboxypeptidase